MLEFDNTASVDLASAFDDMIGSAGGVDLSRVAESNPDSRQEVAALLDAFGTWDVMPLEGAEQAMFAAVLCHRAGALNVPYPVAERLTASGLDDIDALTVVSRTAPIIGHGGLGLRWAGISGDRLHLLTEAPVAGAATRIAPFAVDVELQAPTVAPELRRREALSFLLSSFTLLGAGDAAAKDTYAHVGIRRQFGSPVGTFQGLRFSLTDVATALQGARELGLYALWSVATDRDHALADALAFRIAALEAADVTFSRCHQAHGAIGLCDETDLSWLSRHSRVIRHAPWGITRTEQRLLEESGSAAVAGPFSA